MSLHIVASTWMGTYTREIDLHLAATPPAAAPRVHYSPGQPAVPVANTPIPHVVSLQWKEFDFDGAAHTTDLKLRAYNPETIRVALEAALAALSGEQAESQPQPQLPDHATVAQMVDAYRAVSS